ncbi:MAG: hypothetical protein MOB07_19650 [Acidobacteria bacterium]|nr:hypothetical protein [Acidobacteriota bacterium]
MRDESIDRNEAAKIFLEQVIYSAFDGAIKSIQSLLSDGPPGRKPPEDKVHRSQWFNSLDNESQQHVLTIIRDSVDAAVFGCLVLLDNQTVGYPLDGQLSDYALYLQTYSGEDAVKTDQPQVSVRINPAWSTEFLHDMFRWIIDERQT